MNQRYPYTAESGIGGWDKADESGASGLSTETTTPEVEPLRIDLLLFAERDRTHAAFGVLVDEGTPIDLSFFSMIHGVSSYVCRRDHTLCCNPDGRWVA